MFIAASTLDSFMLTLHTPSLEIGVIRVSSALQIQLHTSNFLSEFHQLSGKVGLLYLLALSAEVILLSSSLANFVPRLTCLKRYLTLDPYQQPRTDRG